MNVRNQLSHAVADILDEVDKTMRRIRKNFKEKVENASTEPRVELNATVPDFTANTTHGELQLHTWQKDKWVILFSHPADFTPVCTTEMIEFARIAGELKKRNVALIGNSVDSVYSHIAWVRNIKDKFGVDIEFPIIADVDMKVSRMFGMIHPSASDTAPVRAVYFIDPERHLRAQIYYPLNVGRNFDEILRVVDALQTADKRDVACPANWRPGEAVILPPPKTVADAGKRVSATTAGDEVSDWYFVKRAS